MTKGTVGERYAASSRTKNGIYPNTDAGKAQEIADLNKLVQDMQSAPAGVFRDPAQDAAGDPPHPAGDRAGRLDPLHRAAASMARGRASTG